MSFVDPSGRVDRRAKSQVDGAQADGSPLLRRNLMVGFLVGIPLSLVFLYLAVRGLQPDEVADSLTRGEPVRIALAVALMGVIYSVQAVRWRWIARRDGRLPWSLFLRFVICSVAVNNVVPGRPGEVLRGYWLGRVLRMRQARAFATVVVDRSSDVLFLVAVFAATFAFVRHPPWLRHVFIAAMVLGALVVAAFAAARWHVGGHRSPVGVLSRRLRHSRPGLHAARFVHGAGASVNRRDVAVLAALTCTVWACWAAAAWLVASSLSISVSPLEVVFLTTVINLGAAIPSSPGFVGTFQWLCVSGMALFGVGQADALAFSIIMQAVWYVPTTLIGLPLLMHTGIAAWSHPPGVGDLSSPV